MVTLLVCNQTMAFQTMVVTRSMSRTKKTDIKEKGKAGKCVKKRKSILVDENRAFNMFMIVDYMKRYYETHPFPTTGGITAPEALTGGYLEWLNLSDDERALWIEKFKGMKAEGKSLFTLQNEYYYIYSKRPKRGESRNAPSGSSDFGPRFQPPGVRPMPNTVETVHSHNLPSTWHPMSPQDQAPSSDVGIHTRFPAPSTPSMVVTRSMSRTKKTDIKEKGKAGKCVKKRKSILVDENRAFNMFMIVDYMKRYYETHPFPTTGGITAPEALTGGYLEWLNLSNDERALWIEKFKDMKAEGKSLFTLQNEYYYIYSKRPRPGESRIAPSGSPGFGPRFQPPGVRPMPNTAETVHNHKLPNTWHPLSPQDQVPSSDVGIHTRFPAPSTPGGSAGGYGGSAYGPPSVFPASSSSTLPQNNNQSKPQVPSFRQQISPLQQQAYQSPQQYSSPMQSQSSGSYSQKQTSVAQPTQSIPLRAPTPDSQTFSSPKLPGVEGQLPVSQSENQQSLSPAAAKIPSNTNVPPYPPSGMGNPQQLNPQQQFPLPLHQSTSQLTAQLLSQQAQALQTRLQSSQQAFSEILQQLPMMQPSNQSFETQQGPNATSQQYQAPGYAGHQGTEDLANKQSPVVASSVNYPSRFQQGLQCAQDWMWKNKPKELSHQEC